MFQLSVAAFAAVLAAGAPSPSLAVAQVLEPTGVGGCVFLGISREMRLAAMGAYGVSGAGSIGRTPGLRAAVVGPARQCSGGRDIRSDDALLVAFTSTVMRSVEALELSIAKVGQARLDAAWNDASDAERAPFLAPAQAYFEDAPPPAVPVEAVDALISRLALDRPPAPDIRDKISRYYSALALNVVAEARLAQEPARSARGT